MNLKFRNWNLEIKRKPSGFTLIETLFALFVLTLTASAGFSVMSQSIKLSPITRQQVIAAHLAEEALEIVRNIRDRRLLIIADEISQGPPTIPDRDWAQDLAIGCAAGSGGVFRSFPNMLDWDEMTGGWEIECKTGAVGSFGDRPLVFMDPTVGYMANACSKNQCRKLGWQDTGFRRVMNIEKYVGAVLNPACTFDCTEVRVKVRVYWGMDTEPAVCPGDNCVLMEDRLTNWVSFLEGFL